MNKIVIMDFFAIWCSPCKMQDPILEKLKETFGNKVEFKKIDIDKDSDLKNRYNIKAVPTIIIEKDGAIFKRYIGVTSLRELEKDITDAIGKYVEKKLVKVTMEYDDGSKEYIDGDDVGKWQGALNSAVAIDSTKEGGAQDILKKVTWKKLSDE